MTGHIFHIARSRGGVPKFSVPEGTVGPLGLEGDTQKHTKIHGGPDRALCLFSLEVMQVLQREGHPIYPGSTGENVLIAGVDWSTLHASSRIALGTEVVVELTRTAAPCKTIAASFIDRKFDRLAAQDEMRWYCRVIHGGLVRVAMPVRVL
jgi:MOSC domain-containing protein YiiM